MRPNNRLEPLERGIIKNSKGSYIKKSYLPLIERIWLLVREFYMEKRYFFSKGPNLTCLVVTVV